ncbi:hypothetical protein ACFE04_000769 [Oxalis oulophora]
MASLLANGISRCFSLTSPSSNAVTDVKLHKQLSQVHFPRNHTRRFVKVRADTETTTTDTSSSDTDKINEFLRNREYKQRYGFSIDIDSFTIPKGLSEETIKLISSIKQEPEWMLEFRLNAYKKFVTMKPPDWSDNRFEPIDFQDLCYYSAPKKKKQLTSLDEADPELVKYFDRLGISLNERNRLANVAVDAVLDSVSIATTHRDILAKSGVIFCSISEAVKEYPKLIKKYLGKVVPSGDNYYAALNAAVFSDGSFVYIPKDTKCPMQISTYFRINAMETGQFERTLIVAEDRSFVEYLEGCTAPAYDTNQLHAAVVELYCAEGAEIKYSTVQNWYAGDEEGKGGIYNFVTKRGICAGARSKISWTQVETGSAITWKYPSVVLEGDNSVGEFFSVALTNNYQQADTGTKMIHKGKNTRSRIISKGISVGKSRNVYRGLVQIHSKAENARNSSQCDSMLIGDQAAANTYPTMEALTFCTMAIELIKSMQEFDERNLHLKTPGQLDIIFSMLVRKSGLTKVEHEASTSKMSDDQLFYFQQRGISLDKAMAAMISGFCRDVFNELPDEFGSEMNGLMSIKLENSESSAYFDPDLALVDRAPIQNSFETGMELLMCRSFLIISLPFNRIHKKDACYKLEHQGHNPHPAFGSEDLCNETVKYIRIVPFPIARKSNDLLQAQAIDSSSGRMGRFVGRSVGP